MVAWKHFIDSAREIKAEVSKKALLHYLFSCWTTINPQCCSTALRAENKLYWVLDVSFGDEQSRVRKGNAPRNMAIVKNPAPRLPFQRMKKIAG